MKARQSIGVMKFSECEKTVIVDSNVYPVWATKGIIQNQKKRLTSVVVSANE